jgi:hypothetical protein
MLANPFYSSGRDDRRTAMSNEHLKPFQFVPGHDAKGGRPIGARNRITNALLTKLADDFEAHGDAVIKIARVEKPVEYLRVIASLLPKELAINDAKVGDMTEEEIAGLLEMVRELRAKTQAAQTPTEPEETPRDRLH